MIVGLGYQALAPLCVLMPSRCGLAFVGLGQRLPNARSPPQL
jgi:hypothetical protein